MRIVFDSNVIISAVLLFNSIPRRAFDKAIHEGTVLISDALIFELVDVFGRKSFDKYITEQERIRFLIAFLREAELVDTTVEIQASRDPMDNKILELAVGGNADHIVTGDRDLLILGTFEDISIITPKEFLDI